MNDPPYQPPPEDPELTEEEAEGIRLSMEELDSGVEPMPVEQLRDQMRAELRALARVRRTG
jgi:hypothetical protein